MPNEDKQTVNIGVSMAPIVVASNNHPKINEVVSLQLISGLNSYDLEWINGELIIPTNPDRTVTFTEPGVYQARVLKQYILHESYWITVTE